MITGFKRLLKVQRIQSENFWKCQKNNVKTKTMQSSLCISIRAELLSIGTMILELNYSQLVQCHL